MKKLLVCSVIALGVSLSAQAVNAAPASKNSNSQKRILVEKITCASKKIHFYYINKNGEIVCLIKKVVGANNTASASTALNATN